MLNAIVHPQVLETQDQELAAIEQAEPHAIAVVEAALLIESGYAKKLDYLVVTCCAPEQQLARLMEKGGGRGFTREQASRRIAAQMAVEEKRRMADEVMDCSGSLEYTRKQVIALFAELKRMEAERTNSKPEGEKHDQWKRQ
jgi:dephospho-CoA kinase